MILAIIATTAQSAITWEMVALIGVVVLFALGLFALFIWGASRSK